MFAYCINNPVRKIDVFGTVCEDIFDGDGNLATNDDKRFNGHSSPTGGVANSTNSSGYKPPVGGGGTTDSVNVGGVRVDFGHGGCHLDGTGMSVTDMHNAIANDVVTRSVPSAHAKQFPIRVNGIDFLYSAIQLRVNYINVGTYYPVIKF